MFPSGENDDTNNVFPPNNNSSVGRIWSDSLKDQLCNDGSHLEAKGIRANPIPLTKEFVNELYPATINIKLG